MNIFIDVETSGLLIKKAWKFPSYRELSLYDPCRIVSICWLVCQNDKIVEQAYFIIKPDHFIISHESQLIHGISQEDADAFGVSLPIILDKLYIAMRNCSNIVAHNIEFDSNVILSECVRYNKNDLIALIESKHLICTMLKGKEFMNVKKFPKLIELYKYLYNEDLEDAHNALADTVGCFKCYIKMFPSDPSIFFFKDKEIKLTDEQRRIVHTHEKTNVLVVATPGSGKTLTILARIKYLLDKGVDEDSIILTTFTWDAANEMKDKLTDILGYKSQVKIGTIDGISKFFTMNNNNTEIKHVGEYGNDFLNLLKTRPTIINKFKYIFIDEFQDINDTQFEIINEFYKNGVIVFAVGDDSQNIYSFRGSNVKYMMNFKIHFLNNQVLFLTKNFRSSSSIVNLANDCMKHMNNVWNDEKRMQACMNYEEKKPTIQYFSTQNMQADFVVKSIKKYINNDNIKKDEIAVLSPVNQTLFLIEEMLSKENIPNVCLENKNDVRMNRKQNHVCLSTIHKAKGLEWDIVFFINASDDIIPKMKNPKNIEDDRRSFYVAITRPRKELIITYSAQTYAPYISRFISELNNDLYNFIDYKDEYFGNSTMDSYTVEKSIEKTVQLLDGSDYSILKSRNIIPSCLYEKINLYKPHNYSDFINDEHLHIDFSNFMETIINILFDKSNSTRYARILLSHVVLNQKQYILYKKYNNNIKNNIDVCKNINNTLQFKSMIEHNSKPIVMSEINLLYDIIRQIAKNAETYNILPSAVPVFQFSKFSNDFIGNIKDTIDNINKTDIVSIMNNAWSLSKCKRIIKDQRMKLVFKDISGYDLYKQHSELIDNMIKELNDIIKKNKVICNKEFTHHSGIIDTIELMMNDTLISLKTTTKEELNLDWIIYTLLQKVLCDSNNIRINTIIILNVLRGFMYKIDISDWNNHDELINYIMKKRNDLVST